MWKAVYPNSSPLEWEEDFDKNDVRMAFYMEHEGVKSNWYYLGLDQHNDYDFCNALGVNRCLLDK